MPLPILTEIRLPENISLTSRQANGGDQSSIREISESIHSLNALQKSHELSVSTQGNTEKLNKINSKLRLPSISSSRQVTERA